MDSLCVWWLSQLDTELVGEDGPAGVPEYVADEFQSLKGRNGRGRLWVADQFGEVSCDPNVVKPACKTIENLSAGGIVMRQSDIALLPKDVGFVTDLSYDPIGDDQPPGLYFHFSVRRPRQELRNAFWLVIFGTFEISERGDWKLEAFADGSGIRIYHPDIMMIAQLADAYHPTCHHAWAEPRRNAAASALRALLLAG